MRVLRWPQRTTCGSTPTRSATRFPRGATLTLGTDGFGRSDYRVKLRKFFEVNRYYVAVAALKALADEGEIKADNVSEAIKKYGLDTERPDPWTV